MIRNVGRKGLEKLTEYERYSFYQLLAHDFDVVFRHGDIIRRIFDISTMWIPHTSKRAKSWIISKEYRRKTRSEIDANELVNFDSLLGIKDSTSFCMNKL